MTLHTNENILVLAILDNSLQLMWAIFGLKLLNPPPSGSSATFFQMFPPRNHFVM